MEAPGVEPAASQTEMACKLTHSTRSYPQFRAAGDSRGFISFHSRPRSPAWSCGTPWHPTPSARTTHAFLRRTRSRTRRWFIDHASTVDARRFTVSARSSRNVVIPQREPRRIEEWHRAWKGGCYAESISAHSVEVACRWATILGAVAARVRRLKQLAR